MTPILLVCTHLLAAATGGALTYFLTIRYVRVRQVAGHPVLELNYTGEPMSESKAKDRQLGAVGLIGVTLCGLLLIAGVQFTIAQKEGADRDARDSAYADCLTDFAADLVTTIKTRNQATVKVEAAERQRADAADEVFRVTALARRLPPLAKPEDFDRALRNAVLAREKLDRVRDAADKVRDQNPYVYPAAVCSR